MIPQDTTRDAVATLPTVDLSGHAQEETYFIARLLMDADKFLLGLIGQEHNAMLFNFVYAVLVFLLAFVIGYILQWVIVFILDRVGKRFSNDLYTGLIQAHFFTKTSRIVPAIIFLILIDFTLSDKVTLSSWLSRLTWIYIAFIISISFCILAEVIWQHVDARANKKNSL